MSVNDPTAQFGTASAATAGAAPSANFQGRQGPVSTSLMGAANLGINRNTASEVLAAAKTLTLEALKDMPVSGLGQRMVPIDTAQFTNLRLPALVIMLLDEATKTLGYHVLLLEAGGQPLEAESVQVMGNTVLMERYSERVYDSLYEQTVKNVVATNLPDYKIAKGAGTAEVVPRKFSFENKAQLRELLINALSAAKLDVVSEQGSFPVMNLAEPSARDANLNAVYQFGASQLSTPAGLPVRADLRAQLSVSPLEKPASNTVNQGEQRLPYGQAAGFIDFLWAPKAAVQGPLGFQAQQVTQRFEPRLVLTRLEGLINMSLQIQLLTLASLYSLAENAGWYGYCRSSKTGMSSGGVNMKSVGALNIEGNMYNEAGGYGTAVDTESQSFNDAALATLLNALVSQQAIMSLDVSLVGHDSFYNDVFSQAAQGNTRAQQAILAAANELTGGEFAHQFQGNEAMVVSSEPIPMGYYNGRTGECDLRDFDYLAVMNMVGAQNPEFGARWTQAWTDQTKPLALRIQAQQKMLMELSGNTAVFTGTAIRATFRGDFMKAFMSALSTVQVKFNVSNPTMGGEFSSTRATFDWLSAARMSTGISGAFNAGYSNNAGNSGSNNLFGASAASRW